MFSVTDSLITVPDSPGTNVHVNHSAGHEMVKWWLDHTVTSVENAPEPGSHESCENEIVFPASCVTVSVVDIPPANTVTVPIRSEPLLPSAETVNVSPS